MDTLKDLTSEFWEWLKMANNTLDRAKNAREAGDYGNYVSDLQESEEKTSKGIMATFGFIGNRVLNTKILEYYNAVSNGNMRVVKDGNPKAFTHLWAEKFFENILNKETLEDAGL